MAFAADSPHRLHCAYHHLVQQGLQLQGLCKSNIERLTRLDADGGDFCFRLRVLRGDGA